MRRRRKHFLIQLWSIWIFMNSTECHLSGMFEGPIEMCHTRQTCPLDMFNDVGKHPVLGRDLIDQALGTALIGLGEPRRVIEETHGEVERVDTSDEIVVDYEPWVDENDPETKLAYFREDIGANSHHWHWHQSHPFDGARHRDRRGEAFYYMHRQILARYDAERLSNGLNRTTPLSPICFDTVLQEGYDPHLMSSDGVRSYPARPANTDLGDVDKEEIEDMIKWRARITKAIDDGFAVTADGERIKLDIWTGIDLLGNMIESSAMSVHQKFYGHYHNIGHAVIAEAHTPYGKYKKGPEAIGVMNNFATAMRDTIFYRWHKHIDGIFSSHQMTIPPYRRHELELSDIRVNDVFISGNLSKRRNTLQTFWARQRVGLSRGLDFYSPNYQLVFDMTHLQHEEFLYNIDVDNISDFDREVVVRIFLAPMTDKYDQPLTFEEQRTLFIELDKYHTIVRPGRQVLKRRSEESKVTIDPARGFTHLEVEPREGELDEYHSFCGCGWPHHLLIPKGRPGGMSFVLVVMMTDWDEDKADDDPGTIVGDAASYCGVRGHKYPDRRAMGFPFDRRFEDGETLESFARLSNVAMKEVTIKHRAGKPG